MAGHIRRSASSAFDCDTMPAFDLLIVTARDATQQWLFERRLQVLSLRDIAARTLVVADPAGAQAGSGGSTVFALCAALDCLKIPLAPGDLGLETLERRLAGLRMLLIHCGGLSQRLPQYAAIGKTFSPVDPAEPDTTLFEKAVRTLAGLVADFPPGVTLACGDSLYRTGRPATVPAGADAVGWTAWTDAEQGSRHGVFLVNWDTGRVVEALQKRPPAELRERCGGDRVALDSGLLFIKPTIAAQTCHLVASDRGKRAVDQALASDALWRGADLYGRLIPSMAETGPGSISRHEELERIWRQFKLFISADDEFIYEHFGTTRELVALLSERSGGKPSLFNCALDGAGHRLGDGCVLHNCRLKGAADLGAGVFLLGLHTTRSFRVEPHRIAFQLPVSRANGGDALVLLAGEDDPKSGRGGTLLSRPLLAWARHRGLDETDLWGELPEEDRTLWTARVFPVVRSGDVSSALTWLEHGAVSDGWRPGILLSLSQIHAQFNPVRWWRFESAIRTQREAIRLAVALESDAELPVARAVAAGPAVLAVFVARELKEIAAQESRPMEAARLWRTCAELIGDRSVDSYWHQRAFACVRKGLETGLRPGRLRRWSAAGPQVACARAPVRLDLAGGWSDTPPQTCVEGGRVLNAAVLLDGRRPILAQARLLREPVLRFEAVDLKSAVEVHSVAELMACTDPRDPFALHKAAILEAGVIRDDGTPLARQLEAAGGGVLVQTESRVPKGSGLGTSSILGAALLAVLRNLTGSGNEWSELFTGVIRLEQRMTTGGGWQDQIGGMLPGVKVTETAPGWDIRPTVELLPLSPQLRDDLERRLVLYYTGVPRLARNVLQRVVSRYLAREVQTVAVLRRLKRLAERAADAVRAEDLDRLGSAISECWRLNKSLDESCTGPELEALLLAVEPWCCGAKLAGAGGGGFAFFLAHSPEDADCIRQELSRRPSAGFVAATALCDRGLTVDTEWEATQ